MDVLSPADLKKFGLKLCLFLLPLVLVLMSFWIFDPFKIIYKYNDFYADFLQPRVALNRSYVTTEIFLRSRDQHRYDSFIFGSSRSMAFLTEDWRPYLGEKASPFHFDESAETLFGLWSALRFLDRLNIPIRNALLVLDEGVLGRLAENNDFLFIHHPLISGESRTKFYFQFLKGYMSKGFFISYFDLKLFKTYRPYMKKFIENQLFTYDSVTNDYRWTGVEARIAADPEAYYSDESIFYRRDPRGDGESAAVIGEKQLSMLRDIKQIFDQHATDCQIVISPLYGQRNINRGDVQALKSLFGAGRVHDYSGVNALTADVSNYYEIHHYRPKAARAILKEIYAPTPA